MYALARDGDEHECSATDSGKPHVGGAIQAEGVSNVTVNGELAAVVRDRCECQSPKQNEITTGSESVFVGGEPVALCESSTKHQGTVVSGSPDVFVGS